MHRIGMVLAMGFAAPALAQDRTTEEESGRPIQYKERTEIEFDGIQLAAELVRPSASMWQDRERARFHPMIRLREQWVTEIAQSVDDVK